MPLPSCLLYLSSWTLFSDTHSQSQLLRRCLKPRLLQGWWARWSPQDNVGPSPTPARWATGPRHSKAEPALLSEPSLCQSHMGPSRAACLQGLAEHLRELASNFFSQNP